MTQTPYILWAVLATFGALLVYKLGERDVAKAKADLEKIRGKAQDWATAYMAMRKMYLEQYQTLTLIQSKRKASAKHARAAQIAQRRAKILEQASKLVEPKVDRIAA